MLTFPLQLAVLGLGTSAIYALLAQGLVAIHRGSGVLNLAQGALAMLGGYLYWELHARRHVTTWLAFAIIVVVIALITLTFYVVAIRPLRNASLLARVVITLGILLVIQGFVQVVWGTTGQIVAPLFPSRTFSTGGVIVPIDRVWMVGIAVGVTALLWASDRYSRVGLAIRASGQNTRAVAALGWSPELLAGVAWTVGGALAAAAGMFEAPLIGLDTTTLPLLVINVVAAALVGSFYSFPLTMVGALGLGIAQSEVAYYINVPGIIWALPFAVIVLLLAVRGKTLPVRGFFVERLPDVGTGRVRLPVVAVAVAVMSLLMVTEFSNALLDALTVSLCWATIILSVVVLLGYTSQLSFEQMAMAGLAAVIAAHLVADAHIPFAAAFIVAILGAVPIGVIFALPALRTRGINLAVVTLGLGATVFYMVFTNRIFAGGNDGVAVGRQSVLGFSIDANRFPDRYAILVLVAFVVCALAVANIRRGRAGGALIAVRTNERAAAALGISVFTTKLFAFIVGSSLAAVGGILYAFRSPVIPFQDTFAPIQSILAVAIAIIGGVGFVMGPLLGSTFAAGGVTTWVAGLLFTNPKASWISLLGGGLMLVLVNVHPDGIAELQIRGFRKIERRVLRLLRRPAAPVRALPVVTRERARPVTLDVRDLTVRFGPVVAVDALSLSVSPGEVVGLIGPNGAGKTTVIDAVTGFVAPRPGASMMLNGEHIGRVPVHRRVQLGLSRSFQSLELFEQSTVRENLLVASDSRGAVGYGRDIVHPSERTLTAPALVALREFGIEAELDQSASDLSYGRRRLVAITRAIAVDPSILLLDEPAAGLSTSESAHLGSVVRRLADEWGLGVLLIEHDMTFVMNVCHRVIVLDFGHKIAEGTPEQIQRDPAVIAAYLGVPEEPEDLRASAVTPTAARA
jgi:ABC-type branched-subunit amino acid transport system ATPase component/branched-subunit amino acid ABC-type transport system permease component